MYLFEYLNYRPQSDTPTDQFCVLKPFVAAAARHLSCWPEQVCDGLRAEINSRLDTAIATGSDRPPNFALVRTPGHRWDMYLPDSCSPVAAALQELLGGSLGNVFRSTFDGRVDAPVVELSALVSDSGAVCQPLHQDTTMEVQTYTAFVALQDIDERMGPTLLLPGSHTEIAHRLFDHPTTKDEFISEREVKLGTMTQGDVVIMDSRCIHAGGANSSDRRRVLFYFTMRHPLCNAHQVRAHRQVLPQYFHAHSRILLDCGVLKCTWR